MTSDPNPTAIPVNESASLVLAVDQTNDVKEKSEDEKMAHRGTLRDAATGLPNRDLFDDRMAHAIALARRHNWTLAMMILKLDGFKTIDDAHGHAEASRASREIGRRLLQHARAEDAVCRNRDDEFLYLLVNPQGSENVERIAAGLLKSIHQPIDMGRHPQRVINVNIGIAAHPEDGTTAEKLIINAGIALRRAKSSSNGYLSYAAPQTASAKEAGLGDSL
jgi:diguanylate cyclase (GGDEF)-like protein